jgi:DNA (cytosine-5)-methyltransferase 1
MKRTKSPPIEPIRSVREMKRRPIDGQPLLFPEVSANPWRVADSAKEEPGRRSSSSLTSLELCAGAGGQALGYEQAGIEHVALIEVDPHACNTLRLNRPNWRVFEGDLNLFEGAPFKGVDIISGGLPCPPFSIAGKQLGENDERNLFPAMIRLVDQVRPQAVQIENVRGILDASFGDYRRQIESKFKKLGYQTGWKLMNASHFGVPQLRPRAVLVAIKREHAARFEWPPQGAVAAPTVGTVLSDLMASNGWAGTEAWTKIAGQIAPTIVGGSHKHGGPDLGPTRARKAWAALGVDGLGIANEAPASTFEGMPRLTVRMVARLQGFPDIWAFTGGKTAAYRQVGNAFPPPFARAVASSLRQCLTSSRLAVAVG